MHHLLDNPIAAATMNNDTEMMVWLMDNGAFLDFRVGDKDQWKTPLHLAAINNKTSALKNLLQFGAWVDAKDILGLTPLYYACSQGNTECVLRLLLAKADTEVFDENGKGPLHLVI
jgi:ankyrin repeat protein